MNSKMKLIGVVLIILVVMLGGYFIYEKVINKEKVIDKTEVFELKAEVIEVVKNGTVDLFNYLKIENIDKNDITFTADDRLLIGTITMNNGNVTINKLGNFEIVAKYKDKEIKMNLNVQALCNHILASLPTGTLDLSCENVSVKVDDNLEMNFIGTPILDEIPNNETSYQYKLNLKNNGNEVDTDIFKNEYNIFSSNKASRFNVSEFNNTYVFESNVGNQCRGVYAVIYDKSFNILKTFKDVDMRFDNELGIIDIDEYDYCMVPNCDGINEENKNDIVSTKTKYKYNGETLEIVETINKTYKEMCD